MVFEGSSSQRSTNNNTLILGGSFNPIHHGHLLCAGSSAEILGFENVLLIPSGEPPHKQDSKNLAPAEHRLAMCRRSVNDRQTRAGDRSLIGQRPVDFVVSDIELSAKGPSYTLMTARKLREQGIDNINWLIGADQLNALPHWHQPEALLEEVNFIVMARPGFELDWSALPNYMRCLENNWVPAPLLDISATNIRARVAARLSIDWLTPPSVVEYIRQHRLYET